MDPDRYPRKPFRPLFALGLILISLLWLPGCGGVFQIFGHPLEKRNFGGNSPGSPLCFPKIWDAPGCGGVMPTVKIGLVAPFEGLYRSIGYEALFAVKLALQERNRGPGLNGYRVELVALNDFDQAGEARAQAQALAADPDIMGVIGHFSAAATEAAGPIYREAGLAVVIPWSGPEPNTAGMVAIAADQNQTAAHLKTFQQANGFEKIASLKDNRLELIPPDAEAIELAAKGVAAGETILALERAAIALPLFGQVEVGRPQLIQVAGETANGLIFVSPAPAPADLPASQEFSEAYQALAGYPPGPRAVMAYDATHTLLDAIDRAIQQEQLPDRAAVKAALPAISREGISGPIAFDAQGRRRAAPVWLYQISEGKYPGAIITPGKRIR